jgi:hypothetical protein
MKRGALGLVENAMEALGLLPAGRGHGVPALVHLVPELLSRQLPGAEPGGKLENFIEPLLPGLHRLLAQRGQIGDLALGKLELLAVPKRRLDTSRPLAGTIAALTVMALGALGEDRRGQGDPQSEREQ